MRRSKFDHQIAREPKQPVPKPTSLRIRFLTLNRTSYNHHDFLHDLMSIGILKAFAASQPKHEQLIKFDELNPRLGILQNRELSNQAVLGTCDCTLVFSLSTSKNSEQAAKSFTKLEVRRFILVAGSFAVFRSEWLRELSLTAPFPTRFGRDCLAVLNIGMMRSSLNSLVAAIPCLRLKI